MKCFICGNLLKQITTPQILHCSCGKMTVFNKNGKYLGFYIFYKNIAWDYSVDNQRLVMYTGDRFSSKAFSIDLEINDRLLDKLSKICLFA